VFSVYVVNLRLASRLSALFITLMCMNYKQYYDILIEIISIDNRNL